MQIITYPHPTLRRVSKPLRRVDAELRGIIRQMFDLMYEAKGIGLAANQVDLPLRLFIVNLEAKPDAGQELVFINPVIVERKGFIDDEEGCLSFPGLYQKVKRAKTIKVHAYDLTGRLVEKVVSDLEARAWQHEIDHLNGVLFIDKMGVISKIAARGSVKEFERKFRKAQERGEIPPDADLEKLLVALESQG